MTRFKVTFSLTLDRDMSHIHGQNAKEEPTHVRRVRIHVMEIYENGYILGSFCTEIHFSVVNSSMPHSPQ